MSDQSENMEDLEAMVKALQLVNVAIDMAKEIERKTKPSFIKTAIWHIKDELWKCGLL